jgi:hypothetical protein
MGCYGVGMNVRDVRVFADDRSAAAKRRRWLRFYSCAAEKRRRGLQFKCGT